MATEIYLGNPPQHVIDWIKAHSKPAGNPKTKITFTNGTSQEYDWSGEINYNTMTEAGLLGDNNNWIKKPQTVEIGTNVTSMGTMAFGFCDSLTSVIIPNSVKNIAYGVFNTCTSLTNVTIPDSITEIGPFAFWSCTSLTSMTIPDSVTNILDGAFLDCSSLTNITFSGKDKATVQGMEGYNWNLTSSCVIHCTDGDITL